MTKYIKLRLLQATAFAVDCYGQEVWSLTGTEEDSMGTPIPKCGVVEDCRAWVKWSEKRRNDDILRWYLGIGQVTALSAAGTSDILREVAAWRAIWLIMETVHGIDPEGGEEVGLPGSGTETVSCGLFVEEA